VVRLREEEAVWVISASSPSSPVSAGSISESSWLFRALESSVAWRGNLRPAKSWRLAWRTGRLIRIPSGLTSPPSAVQRGVDEWISSLAASPASPSPSLESDGEHLMSGGCGMTPPASSEKLGRASCSSKTCRVCSLPPGEIAYVAGLIDGEGCIGITKSKGYYYARMDMGMTEVALPILNWLHARFGGSVRQNRAETEKWAAAFAWTMQGKKAAAFCRCIAPWLRLKRRQAEIVSRPGLNGQSKEEIHRLNQKGPSQAPGGWFARLVGGRWTAPATLFEPSPEFSGRWPVSGSMRNGACYRRAPVALPTVESGFSFWPTAAARDWRSDSSQKTDAEIYGKKGRPLPRVVQSWPTATEQDSRGSEGTTLTDAAVREPKWASPHANCSTGAGEQGQEGGPNLQTQASLFSPPAPESGTPGEPSSSGGPSSRPMWPTAIAGDAHLGSTKGAAARRLTEGKATLSRTVEAAAWTTPQARDGSGGGCHQAKPDGRGGRRTLTGDVGGQRRLNPLFVEWLMGLPPGWTDFAPLATRLCLSRQRSHLRNLLGG
jgi:hypothetical protein